MHNSTLVIDAFWVANHTFPTEQFPDSNVGKLFHKYYAGPKQHLGWMDLLLLKKIIKERHISHIILKNLSALGKIAEATHCVQICTTYEYKNIFIIPSIQKDTNLKKCKPLYKTIIFGGWNLSEDDSNIPERAQRYIKYLLVETNVESITCQTNKIKMTAHFDSDRHVVFDTELIT